MHIKEKLIGILCLANKKNFKKCYYEEIKYIEKISNRLIYMLDKANLIKTHEQRTTFFTNIAHETKTPLSLIKNYFSDYLKTVPITKELIIIKQNIDKLSRNLLNFLDTEKLNKMMDIYDHDQIIDLSNILKQMMSLFQPFALKKNIKIKSNIQENLFIKINPYAIDRILNNLIDNAIKYSKDTDGHINMVLKSIADNNIMEISDTGIGISEDQIPFIFSPYYQILHKKQNIQGVGLGL